MRGRDSRCSDWVFLRYHQLGLTPIAAASTTLTFNCGEKKLTKAKLVCTKFEKLALDATYSLEKKSVSAGATYSVQSDLKLRGSFDTGLQNLKIMRCSRV